MRQQPTPSFEGFTYITPIVCPHCGGRAELSRRMLDPVHPLSEIRTFECARCGKQSEMRVE